MLIIFFIYYQLIIHKDFDFMIFFVIVDLMLELSGFLMPTKFYLLESDLYHINCDFHVGLYDLV